MLPIPGFHFVRSCRFLVVALGAAALVMSGRGLAQRNERKGLSNSSQHENRDYDARAALTPAADLAATARQQSAIDALRAQFPDLEASIDEATGATRTLWNRVGYLTGPRSGTAREIADAYVSASLDLLGLVEADVAEREVTDVVYTRVTGATHIYYRQRVSGVPVYNAQLHVNVNRDGRIISVNNGFVPNLAAGYNSLQPGLDAADAVRSAADHLGIADAVVRGSRVERAGPRQDAQIDSDNLSTEPVRATLMLLPIRRGEVRLVWNFQVHTLDDDHAFDFTVDADSRQVWTRFDWVASDQYLVYPRPAESPGHISPAPPADGRTAVVNPANLLASPFLWHDTNGTAGAEYTILRGNNAHAYEDSDSNDTPPASQPDCGTSLNCTFALDLAQEPSAYTAAAVANLFYWNNIVHDVQYQYGFDEAAGNFQVNNYGRGGRQNDDVRAEAQDGAGMNNANFLTPPDGGRPRMQMYVWNDTLPLRDGDFDNGVIVHEYGHGISNRLVGGPSNVSCLRNPQQPGEGLSDWWSLVYTAKAGDTAGTPRGIGTYPLGQPTTGAGIRGVPYTTNTSVNNWTYASIDGRSVPHGVGAVWAQAMWRVYWTLVDEYGFSANLYNATGGAGNQRAMLYVNEGLKNTACSPTFADVRDGIIQAALDTYGGADVCRLWSEFAAFGLGTDAVSGGPYSTTPINGFNLPVACGGTPLPAISINNVSVSEGNTGTTTATFSVSLAPAATSEVRVNYVTEDATATSSTAFTSSGSIAIRDSGAASPYPSSLAVSGVTGTIQRLAVRLNSLSHTFTGDLDILLVGPGGQKIMLMSDAGGSSTVNGVSLTFQDGAGALTAPVRTGTYAPVDLESGETLPAPAPPGPYVTSLARFNGTSPNGTWRLYVVDDGEGDAGSIAGWSLLVTTAGADYMATSGELVFPAGVTSRTVSVLVNGDTAVEGHETFAVNLSSVNGPASIADAQGIATIVNDDLTLPPVAATLKAPLRRMGIRPTYEWNAVSSATWYLLWVDDRSGNRLQQWYTAAQAGCATDGACAVTPAIDLNVGAVNWWIQTWSSAGYGPWSVKGVFTAATEKFVVGLGRGGTGEFQLWSNAPALRQASLDLPWAPYNAVNGEVHPATGDVDGDGLDEIVLGLGVGGHGYLAVFDDAAHGFALLKWLQLPWPAYNAANGTTWPAVGDIDGDGRDEIVAGLGQGGAGYYAVFGDAAQAYAFQSWQRVTWTAYNSATGGETHPAIANVDGGAESEIIIGLGAGGAGWLALVDNATAGYAFLRWLRVDWSAYAAGPGETYPAAGDVDGDGFDELVVGLGPNSHGWVEVLEVGATGAAHKSWLQTTWPAYNGAAGETHPAVGNLDGDAAMEIVLGFGVFAGKGGWVEIRDDSAARHQSLGWSNAGRNDAYINGAATFPAIGKVR